MHANEILHLLPEAIKGKGTQLSKVKVVNILKANNLWPNKLGVGEIKLPTGARIVVEDRGKKKAFFLRVNERDCPDWKEAFWKHVKEAGGLEGGYRVGGGFGSMR